MALFVPGPAGQLEALFHEPLGLADGAPPRAVSVVCHPHPAHGGNMHSTVTFKTARGLQSAGIACLRLNFRGVGESAGAYHGDGGEEGDARAGLDWLAARYPGVPVWAAGFSFGSRTVFGLAKRDRRIERLVLVGFPARAYPLAGVDTLDRPAYFIWGADDEFGTLRDLREQYPNLPPSFEFTELPGADHFFKRSTKELEEHVHAYANRALAAPTES
jgi:uncharacterized protein